MSERTVTDTEIVDWLQRESVKGEGLLLHSLRGPTGRRGLQTSFDGGLRQMVSNIIRTEENYPDEKLIDPPAR